MGMYEKEIKSIDRGRKFTKLIRWIVALACLVYAVLCVTLCIKEIIETKQDSISWEKFDVENCEPGTKVRVKINISDVIAQLERDESYSPIPDNVCRIGGDYYLMRLNEKATGEYKYVLVEKRGGFTSSDPIFDELFDGTKHNISAVECNGLWKKAEKNVLEEFQHLLYRYKVVKTQQEAESVIAPYCFQTTPTNYVAYFILASAALLAAFGNIYWVQREDAGSKKAIRELKRNDVSLLREVKNETVEINGVTYPIHRFDPVDLLIRDDKKSDAVRTIRNITGLSLEESVKIMEHWNEYYK